MFGSICEWRPTHAPSFIILLAHHMNAIIGSRTRAVVAANSLGCSSQMMNLDRLEWYQSVADYSIHSRLCFVWFPWEAWPGAGSSGIHEQSTPVLATLSRRREPFRGCLLSRGSQSATKSSLEWNDIQPDKAVGRIDDWLTLERTLWAMFVTWDRYSLILKHPTVLFVVLDNVNTLFVIR